MLTSFFYLGLGATVLAGLFVQVNTFFSFLIFFKCGLHYLGDCWQAGRNSRLLELKEIQTLNGATSYLESE